MWRILNKHDDGSPIFRDEDNAFADAHLASSYASFHKFLVVNQDEVDQTIKEMMIARCMERV